MSDLKIVPDTNDNPAGSNILRIEMAAHKVPRFVENRRDDWVTYGEDNMYPQYLIELVNRSGLHNAIVTGKVNDIFGKGFTPKVNHPKVLGLIESFNLNESMNEVGYKVINSLEVFNGVALEIIWNKAGTGFFVNHLEFANVRSNIDNSKFYYSTDWRSYAKPKDVVTYKPFNKDDRTGKQLFYFKVYRTGIRTYPLPDYIGIIPQIESDIEVANYHLSNIKNGFWGGMMVTFIGAIPTREEQKLFKEQFTRQKTGTDNAGQFVVIWAPDKDHAPIITPIVPSDNDKQFDILNDKNLQDIFSGHKVVSPMLFGQRTEGQLGGRDELEVAHKIFAIRYRNPRAQIVEKIFNFLIECQTGVRNSVFLEPITFFEATDGGTNSKTATPENANPNEAKLSKQDSLFKVMSMFAKYGVDGSDAVILKSHGLPTCMTAEGLDKMEMEFAVGDVPELTELHTKVLNLLNENPSVTDDDLATKLKVSVTEIISDLVSTGYVKVTDSGERTLTKVGKTSVKENKPVSTTRVTYYRYALRTDAPPLVQGGETREFCEYMLSLNRLYSRQDIDAMGLELGYDVWSRRGGWYHNPKTHVNEYSCRHEWKQVLVAVPQS